MHMKTVFKQGFFRTHLWHGDLWIVCSKHKARKASDVGTRTENIKSLYFMYDWEEKWRQVRQSPTVIPANPLPQCLRIPVDGAWDSHVFIVSREGGEWITESNDEFKCSLYLNCD